MVSQPELSDTVNAIVRRALLNVNCCHIATIQSFNATLQTATATINYKKAFLQIDENGAKSQRLEDYPIISNAPVMLQGGGGFQLTFPIKKGDECTVFFNDRDLDNWYMGKSNSAPATLQMHSFGDAIIFPGIHSLANVILNYSTDAAELRNKTGLSKVSVSDSELLLKNATTEVLLTSSSMLTEVGPTTSSELTATGKFSVTNPSGEVIALLYDMIQLLATSTTPSGPLSNAAAVAAKLALFTTFKA